jgi:hypothetical protein
MRYARAWLKHLAPAAGCQSRQRFSLRSLRVLCVLCENLPDAREDELEREPQHKLGAPIPECVLAAAGEDLAEEGRTQIRDRSGFIHRVQQVLELDVGV